MASYCTKNDVAAVAYSGDRLEELPDQDVRWAIDAASAEADAYLAKAGLLPLATVDLATKMHVAKMAACTLFAHQSTPEDERRLREGRMDALEFFKMIAAGTIESTSTTDTGGTEPDPTTASGAGAVVSLPERGWYA